MTVTVRDKADLPFPPDGYVWRLVNKSKGGELRFVLVKQ